MVLKLKSTSPTPTTRFRRGISSKPKSTSPTPITRFCRGTSSKPKSTYPTPHHEMSSWLHHHMHCMLLQAAGENVLASFCLLSLNKSVTVIVAKLNQPSLPQPRNVVVVNHHMHWMLPQVAGPGIKLWPFLSIIIE